MASLIKTIDLGPNNIVRGAELDFYGQRLATWSANGIVKILQVSSGEQTLLAELKEHDKPVSKVAFGAPRHGHLLASGGLDGKVVVWKEFAHEQWTKIFEYINTIGVKSVAWAPAEFGKLLACGMANGNILLLRCDNTDVWSSEIIPNAHAFGCSAISWCPYNEPGGAVAGKLTSPTASSNIKRFVSGGGDKKLKIWCHEGAGWKTVSELQEHTGGVKDVAWVPEAFSMQQRIASVGKDRRVIVWKSDNFIDWTAVTLRTFEVPLWSVSWSLVGNILGVSLGDGKVCMWKEESNEEWTCLNGQTNELL